MRTLMVGALVALAFSGLQGCASISAGPALLSLGTSIFGGVANGAVFGGSAARVILGPDSRDHDAEVEMETRADTNLAKADEGQEPGPQLSAHLHTLLSTPLRSHVPTQVADSR